MSRSIHETRRDEERERRRCLHDRDAPLGKLEQILDRRGTKRDVKRRAGEERIGAGRTSSPPGDPATIPIEVRGGDRHVHYPASPDDLRAVLRRLGPDLPGGIRAIRLVPGSKRQREWIRDGRPGQFLPDDDPIPPDPLTGRPGIEILPGVYEPPLLGTWQRPGDISLHAYVYAPDRANRRLVETFLRVRMLSTLVHEVGHHEDHVFRSVRGRWRMADSGKAERYAEERQYRWLTDAVVPSVEERYPEEVRDLLDWVEEHGGARLCLHDLAGEPRWTTRKGFVNLPAMFPLEDAFWALLRDVEEGVDPFAAKVRFAEEIHYSERYDASLSILDAVLRERPDDVEARVVRGDVLEHLCRHDEARADLERALELAPGHRRALDVLANVCFWSFQWSRVVELARESLAGSDGDRRDGIRARSQLVRALIELGRYDEAEAALPDPAEDGPLSTRFEGLRALSALRRGDPDRALDITGRLSADDAPPSARLLLRAVRRAALLRLGRDGEAEPLSPRDREAMNRQGLADLT